MVRGRLPGHEHHEHHEARQTCQLRQVSFGEGGEGQPPSHKNAMVTRDSRDENDGVHLELRRWAMELGKTS